jgi:hypothetical protein
MKTVSIALEDDLYEAASIKARQSRKSLAEFLKDVFLLEIHHSPTKAIAASDTLNSIWQLADKCPISPGTVEPLNREDCYERGLLGH